MTLDALNALPVEVAERELSQCCGSTRWATAMAAQRPFGDIEALYRAAEDVWASLDGGDWLEAFSRHPRIGQRAGGLAQHEQAGALGAPPQMLGQLADLNHEYERKFGHVFLICATGKGAEEMLDAMKARMHHSPATELRIAAAEQAKITRLRLERLLSETRKPSGVV